jgi:EAL domain-containing protein (putative c-di-GMP-specific phosphodiesterase class I)/GGDEF domain-containing protein
MSFFTQLGPRLRGSLNLATGRPQLTVFLPALLLTAYWLAGEAAMVLVAVAIPAGLALFWIAELAVSAFQFSSKMNSASATRRSCEDMLTRGIKAQPQTGKSVACLCLGLDHDTNDGPKLNARERILLSHQISSCIAMEIRDDDQVIALGPLRFAVALAPSKRADLEAMINLAKRLQSALAGPQNLAGSRHFHTACVGICLPSRSTAPNGAALIDCAEQALNEAQAKGHGSICTFSPRLQKDRNLRDDMARALQSAIEAQRILPVYQPQMRATDGQIAAIHAEPGWTHALKGKISQSNLMPLIAQSGQQANVDKQVLSQIARQLRLWDESGMHVPFVSYRLHAVTLEDTGFPDVLAWEIDRYNLAADRICIGLPHAWVVDREPELSATVISRLTGMGVPLELHGFGKSHLTLPDISRFGVDRVVLDAAFSVRIDRDEDQQRIVRALVEMARNLSLVSVVRGIDTVAEYNMARQIGCDVIQGLSVCGPVDAEDMTCWLGQRQTLRSKRA